MRKSSVVRPIVTILAATMLMVALACGGEEAATPTSVPTATSRPTATVAVPTATTIAPTATSAVATATLMPGVTAVATATATVAATSTPVPEVVVDLTYGSAEDLKKHPAWDPTWGEPKYGGTLKWRTNMPMRPNTAIGGGANNHYSMHSHTMFNQLVRMDPWLPPNAPVEPDLAESWEMSQDGLTYTFHLRKGVYFRSATPEDTKNGLDAMPGRGQEVTCEDVKATYDFIGTKRAWDDSAGIQGQGGAATDINGNVLHTWSCPDGPQGYTVVVRMDRGIPEASFLYNISLQGGKAIMNKEWLEWYAANYPPNTFYNRNMNIGVGTGAFVPVEYVPEVIAKVRKNPNYFRKELPFLDAFHYYSIPDATTGFAAWVTAKIDVLGQGSGSMYAAQVKQAIEKYPDKPLYQNHYYGARASVFNTQRPPFDNVKVRMAVHLVHDRQQWHQLQRISGDNYAGLLTGLFRAERGGVELGAPWGYSMAEVFTWPGYRQPKDQDIAEANRLLDEVFGKGNRPGPLNCLARADQTSINTCLYTGAMMEQYLGIKLNLTTFDPASVTSQTAACNWTVAVTTLPGWDPIPMPYERLRTYDSRLQGRAPCLGGMDPALQAKYNGIMDKVEKTIDPVELARLSKEGEYTLLNEMVIGAGMEWQNLWYGGQPWLRGLIVGDHSVTTRASLVVERVWLVK